MKTDIHPDYRPVVFRDKGTDFAFLTRSTVTTENTVEWEDGNTYPVYDVEVSSAGHGFYTGTQRLVHTGGRIDRFERRYGKRKGASSESEATDPDS